MKLCVKLRETLCHNPKTSNLKLETKKSAAPLCNSLNTIHFQKNSVHLCVKISTFNIRYSPFKIQKLETINSQKYNASSVQLSQNHPLQKNLGVALCKNFNIQHSLFSIQNSKTRNSRKRSTSVQLSQHNPLQKNLGVALCENFNIQHSLFPIQNSKTRNKKLAKVQRLLCATLSEPSTSKKTRCSSV